MDIEFVDNFLNQKLLENENYIRITFYELRIKYNLSEDKTKELLNLAKTRFENLNYKIYLTGENYTYENISKKVETNELMIAIK